MQAKEKSLSDLAGFNTDFKLEVDNNLPKIEVVPQEIECVLLNLINNAFYAVQAPPLSRSELGTGSGGGIRETGKNYKPLVIARTASFIPPTVGPTRSDDPVGRGGCYFRYRQLPRNPRLHQRQNRPILLYHKPTGQRAGLGLSLSYDIVKALGGEISLESVEGEGTEFIVKIPIINHVNH